MQSLVILSHRADVGLGIHFGLTLMEVDGGTRFGKHRFWGEEVLLRKQPSCGALRGVPASKDSMGDRCHTEAEVKGPGE